MRWRLPHLCLHIVLRHVELLGAMEKDKSAPNTREEIIKRLALSAIAVGIHHLPQSGTAHDREAGPSTLPRSLQ